MIKRLFTSLLIICCANFAYGDYITQNVSGGCENSLGDSLYAVFSPTVYTCGAGYYLPANHDGCVACPSGHTCSGGTYSFNETATQGITYNMPIAANVSYGCNDTLIAVDKVYAVFALSQYTCAGGQYLPANAVACTACPAGSYCAGGTYTFNASETQGITGTCAANTYSAAGAASCTACDTGYSSATGAGSCTANTININWDGLSGASATTQCTYDGAITTPTVMPTRRGHAFAGWTFITQ